MEDEFENESGNEATILNDTPVRVLEIRIMIEIGKPRAGYHGCKGTEANYLDITPIENFGLSPRLSNLLKRLNIKTVGEALEQLETGDIRGRGLGPDSFRELCQKLAMVLRRIRN